MLFSESKIVEDANSGDFCITTPSQAKARNTLHTVFCKSCLFFVALVSMQMLCSCKSECEKAAEFSATDYKTASEALDHKLILNLKCKEEIDKLGLDKKSAAQKYCDHTKDCAEINKITIAEQKEERQAKAAELKTQIDNSCPNEKYKLNKELTSEQRRKCWNSKRAYAEFTNDKIHDHYYWSLASAVVGISKDNIFKKNNPTGNLVTSTRYIYTDDGLLVCIDAMNQAELNVYFTDDDMAFFVNGKRVSSSETPLVVRLNERMLKRGDMRMFCWLYKSDSYHSYEDYISMNLHVYLTNDTLGLARIFPTVGPTTKDDNIRESSDSLHKLDWPHIAKGYTSNEWLFDLNGIESMKDSKVYDSQEQCLDEMQKIGIYK